MKNLGLLISTILIFAFAFSETGCNVSAVAEDTQYKIPIQLDDGLKTGDANLVGLNPEILENARAAIERGRYNDIDKLYFVDDQISNELIL